MEAPPEDGQSLEASRTFKLADDPSFGGKGRGKSRVRFQRRDSSPYSTTGIKRSLFGSTHSRRRSPSGALRGNGKLTESHETRAVPGNNQKPDTGQSWRGSKQLGSQSSNKSFRLSRAPNQSPAERLRRQRSYSDLIPVEVEKEHEAYTNLSKTNPSSKLFGSSETDAAGSITNTKLQHRPDSEPRQHRSPRIRAGDPESTTVNYPRVFEDGVPERLHQQPYDRESRERPGRICVHTHHHHYWLRSRTATPTRRDTVEYGALGRQAGHYHRQRRASSNADSPNLRTGTPQRIKHQRAVGNAYVFPSHNATEELAELRARPRDTRDRYCVNRPCDMGERPNSFHPTLQDQSRPEHATQSIHDQRDRRSAPPAAQKGQVSSPALGVQRAQEGHDSRRRADRNTEVTGQGNHHTKKPHTKPPTSRRHTSDSKPQVQQWWRCHKT